MTWVFCTCVTEFHPIRGIHFCLSDWMFKFTLAVVTGAIESHGYKFRSADDRQACSPESLQHNSLEPVVRVFYCSSCLSLSLPLPASLSLSLSLSLFLSFLQQHQAFAPLSIRFAVQPNFLNGNCYSCHCVSSALALCLWQMYWLRHIFFSFFSSPSSIWLMNSREGIEKTSDFQLNSLFPCPSVTIAYSLQSVIVLGVPLC